MDVCGWQPGRPRGGAQPVAPKITRLAVDGSSTAAVLPVLAASVHKTRSFFETPFEKPRRELLHSHSTFRSLERPGSWAQTCCCH